MKWAAHTANAPLACDTGRVAGGRRRCHVSSMVAAPSAEAERPREHAAAAPALLPRIGCRQRRSDQRRREWRSGQRPMQRPLRRVHLLAVCQPAVPNLSGGGRGTKPPGRYSALKPPICTRQHPRQPARERSIDRGPSSTRLCMAEAGGAERGFVQRWAPMGNCCGAPIDDNDEKPPAPEPEPEPVVAEGTPPQTPADRVRSSLDVPASRLPPVCLTACWLLSSRRPTARRRRRRTT